LGTIRNYVLGAHGEKELGPTVPEKERMEWGAATDVSLEGRNRATWGSSPRRGLAQLRPANDSCMGL